MISETKIKRLEEAIAPTTIKQIWRDENFPDPAWERGAIDAYNTRRPQRSSHEYLSGYVEQLKYLPVDKHGNIEFFRYRPDGGWKLTDNI